MAPVQPRIVKPRKVRARGLRRRSEDAEWKLWHELRNRKLDGFKFRRQHPIGRFIVDFACIEARLIVELDGWRHDLPEQRVSDAGRSVELAAAGWLAGAPLRERSPG